MHVFICTPCSGISLLCSVAIGLAAWGNWKGKDIPEAAPKILAALGWSKVLKFWIFKCEIKRLPMRGHAYKTFPFPMNTFHFVNCFMCRIKRLNGCLEGCSLTCRILLWGLLWISRLLPLSVTRWLIIALLPTSQKYPVLCEPKYFRKLLRLLRLLRLRRPAAFAAPAACSSWRRDACDRWIWQKRVLELHSTRCNIPP